MIIYLGHVWPFESFLLTKLEMFNEVVSVLICYFMMIYTDWVPSSETRYLTGWCFIALLFIHLVSHLSLLIAASFVDLKSKSKRKYYRRKAELRLQRYA